MSGQGSNQSVASPMTRVRSQLECPVCFNIPRDLPLPSCPSGHFVCRPCKTRVRDCPTCRQPMPANSTNSVVGALIEQVEHRCKFSDQGCVVKMMLNDLVAHEKQCPERTFHCPYTGCDLLVKLREYDSHALKDKHSLNFGGNSIQYFIPAGIANDIRPVVWPMGCIQALDELFHVNFAYHVPSKSFVFSIWLAKSQNVASKYKANLIFKGDDSLLRFDGLKVSSVENAPSINKCMEDTESISLCLPINLAKKISAKEQEEESLDMEVIFEKV